MRAVFAMAPAVGQAFDQEGLSSVGIPVHIVGSRGDELTRFELNAAHYASELPAAQLTVVHPGGHFVCTSSCNDLGRGVASLVCFDPDPATDRRTVHEQIAAEGVRFFRRELD
ncbi:MAG: hypothetical protein P8R42_19920 [Candidatus Binatia bacterium]|nr:hypothetical protein [Candidatus Binatia bacterium]